jgi:hypothetical protein
MSYFSANLASYIDATLGWDFSSYEALKGVFSQYMPNWSHPARSYATRILAAIDFVAGKIVRWVDYWDSSSFDTALYTQFRTPDDTFPRGLKDSQVTTQAATEMVNAATALQQALGAADGSATGELMHTDVVLEDMALRSQVIGRIEVTR